MNNTLRIRAATPQDKTAVAILMVQAMSDLALKFVNSTNPSDAIPVFEIFFQQKGNLYSYENTLVCEDEDGIAGSITGYDGGKLIELRTPFLEYVKQQHGFADAMEEETSAGEFYLDTVSILPSKQGKGIGTALINKLINKATSLGHTSVGLLVDATNPQAKKLYERIGFKTVGEKTLLGGTYFHLVVSC